MSKAKFMTPKGTAKYPWFTVPDTEYNADGVYKTDLLIAQDEAKPLMTKAKELFIEEFGEKSVAAAQWPFKVDEESGGVRFRVKSSKKPALYDGAGNLIKDDLRVGTGSIIKVDGQMSTYDAGGKKGVTMYLNAAQIIELQEIGGANFTAEEGAYVHDTPAFAAEEESSDGSTSTIDF